MLRRSRYLKAKYKRNVIAIVPEEDPVYRSFSLLGTNVLVMHKVIPPTYGGIRRIPAEKTGLSF